MQVSKFLLIGLLLLSCRQRHDQEIMNTFDSINEELISAHASLVKRESMEIDSFTRTKNWTMITTGSGLRYELVEHGNGKKSSAADSLVYTYRANFMDGQVAISISADRPLRIMTGRGMEVRGVDEAFLLLRERAKARLVLPAHLGYGSEGKGD